MSRTSFLAAALVAALGLYGCGDDTSSGGGGGTGGTDPTGGSGGSGGSGGQLTGEPVKILNWNLHNFFDTIEDPTNTEDDAISQNEYDAKLGAIVDILAELDPDVMVFAEVENEGILDDINASLGGSYVDKSILPGNDPRGVEIAALSKIPFSNVVSHLGETFVVQGTVAPEYTWTRDLVEYHFSVGDQDVVLLGVHFKAKGPPDVPDRRLAEAQRTRAVADALVAGNPDLGVIVLGDFNDLPESPPLNAVTDGNPEYFEAAQFVPQADRWTFDFQGSLELIDHQVVNPRMFGRLDPASVVIRHGTDVSAGSDHRPLMATYYLE